MGAGKTTIGREVARLTQRPFVDTDEEIERRHGPIARIFAECGEAEFRRIEEVVTAEILVRETQAVVALGGGAVVSDETRELLRSRAFTVWIDVDADVAWDRVGTSDRPLASDRTDFLRLYEARMRLYDRAADAVASDVDDVLLCGLHVVLAPGRMSKRVAFGERPLALIFDEHVARLHRPDIEGVSSAHAVPSGESAKRIQVAEKLWRDLQIGRDGIVVVFGGGTTMDLGGFVAATYLRGVPWIAVPTTLVAQVDAAVGGKTGIDVPEAKNAVGAFHFPRTVLTDPKILATLPQRERRNGMAEVVKTGLLAGRKVWELPEEEMIRACAAYKAAVVLSDPLEQTGRRAILNLGHTFAHALEAASDYAVSHGEAVALGLLAALRLSGLPTDLVEEVLRPEPVRVDRERAWAALQRDKKARDGRVRLVLLEAPGTPQFPVEVADEDVRRALGELIAD